MHSTSLQNTVIRLVYSTSTKTLSDIKKRFSSSTLIIFLLSHLFIYFCSASVLAKLKKLTLVPCTPYL